LTSAGVLMSGMRIPTLRWKSAAAARCALLALALSHAGAGRLCAQLISANGIRNVSFGNVLPGVPNTVQPTDVGRSGQFNIVGPSLAQVEITFGLPTVITGPASTTMPISFGATAAGYASNGSIASQVPFNPHVPFRGNLSLLGRASTFLGGVLTPPGTQSAGSYSGSVSMTVALTGL
jgi:uncharacterized protein DUF4402